MKQWKAIMMALMVISLFGLNGCRTKKSDSGSVNITNEPTTKGNITQLSAGEDKGVRESDIPFTRELMSRKPDKPKKDTDTVATVKANENKSQTLYLWEEGNAPAVTEYTENDYNYFDNPDFRPYVTTMPADRGTKIKGAMLLCAGGAFSVRANYTDTIPVAKELNKRGYHCFIVDYRLEPYTQKEGALDLGRTVRFVRKNADAYKIDPKDIGVMGFSAGGIQAGELLLNFKGNVNGTKLDKKYKSDKLDKISADASAAGMIYSFYGRLSVASTDVDHFKEAKLPPTFFCYGDGDPFVDEFQKNIKAVSESGVPVTWMELKDTPHGFGAYGNWIPDYDTWLANVFKNN